MKIINTETSAFRSEAAVRAEYTAANFSPPFFPYPPDVRVEESAQPSFDPLTQEVVEAQPVQVDGVWTQAWTVQSLPVDVAAQKRFDAVSMAWAGIKAKRDHLSDTGGYTVAGKWFHSDQKSKTQQLGLFIMGANVPAVPWKTMDGSFITMTQQLAAGIFQAAAQQDMALFAAAETHRVAMEKAADPLAYNYDGGWPAVYGG